MKRTLRVLIVLALCLFTILPTTALAATFKPSETAISIALDENYWYVLTRDNLENNPVLDELGISYDYMYSFFHDNDAYLDAIVYYEADTYLEVVIRYLPNLTSGSPDNANLSDQSDADVEAFASSFASSAGAKTYTTCTINNYKFAKAEIVSSGTYSYSYSTVVNYDGYTVTFLSPISFSSEQHSDMNAIMNTISFDVDAPVSVPSEGSGTDTSFSVPSDAFDVDIPTYTPTTYVPGTSSTATATVKTEKEDDDSFFDSALGQGILTGAITGGAAGLISAIVNKKKKKKAEAAAPTYDTYNTYPTDGSSYDPYSTYPTGGSSYDPYSTPPSAPYGSHNAPQGQHNRPQGQHNRPDGQHNYR